MSGQRRVVATDRPALRRCVAVPPDRFAAEYWSVRPLLSTAADLPRGFGDLFSLAAVDELVSRRGLRTPFLRIAKEGAVVDGARFTRGAGAGAEIADQVADDRVLDFFANGSTLVLQALHRTWPALGEFGRAITADLGHPVQINAYLTPAQNTGFSAHYDVHDVFVLQVAGAKRWVIHEPVRPLPLGTEQWTEHRAEVAAAAKTEPALAAVLRPGDALYLPRGYLHAAEALGAVSAHLTVGIHPFTRYAIVETLAALAADLPELRGSLPLGVDVADPGQVAPDLAAVVTTLAAWLADADPAAVADQLRRRLVAAVPPAPVAPLAQAAAAATVDVGTRIRLRGGVPYRLDADGDRVRLEMADRQLSLPPSTEPALKAVLAGEPLAVGELPGLDPPDQRTLAGRLLREAIVVPVPP
jgi:ribosomal protein L16 Arg81 hydroxylase